MKKIWKHVGSRVWLIVTAIVLVLAVVVNVLASTTFFNLVDGYLNPDGSMKLVGEDSSRFDKDFETKAETLANGNKVTKEVCEEGFTLLKNKNNAALPLKSNETKVSVFGKNSVDMAIGGSGSGGSVGADAKTIFDSLTASGFTYNQALVDFYKDNTKSGPGRDANPTDLDNGNEVTLSEGETPQTSYTADVWNSCADYKDVALIVVTRIGGEGFDMPRSSNGTHYLQLSQNEKDLIAAVKQQGFGKVVLVVNAAATLELKEVEEDEGIDAILWTGYAGGNGMMAFGEILKGVTLDGAQISPSGKTVDTYAADFTKNPTWNNFGAALGSPASKVSGDAYFAKVGRGYTAEPVYFVDYEESVYVGYRYYETAYAEAQEGNYDFNYDEEVVYPFGYGLSYTSFTWSLENGSEVTNAVLAEKTAITFKVKVTNTGSYPGRDTVQLYVTPPHTHGGIEKSAKVLVGFAKTELLQPGASETVEITVDSPYEFASYDYKDANNNGFKGYEAEAGTYTFAVSTDAHTSVFDVNTSIAAGIKYEKDPTTETTVSNLYTDNQDEMLNSDAQLGSVLSRGDFAGTWPATRANSEKQIGEGVVTQAFIDAMKSTDANPNRPSKNDAMPTTGEDNGISLLQLVGLDYNDDMWNDFMDQMTVAEMTKLVNNGAFQTEMIERLGIPATLNSDGPVGWTNFMFAEKFKDCTVYCCEVVLASTWNVDRLYDMGQAVGNEGLVGNISGDTGLPYTGWYAPGLNIHRSPFGGRNFEYYSEDPFLSGTMTSAVMQGAASKGVYTTIKHFALNDQETHRSSNGVLTWATEQSMREIYLKAFEIAIKTSKEAGVKSMGVMTSFNRIGTRWAGGDYRLLTNILREEWGFEGQVICDFNTCTHMVEKDMFYAGGDLNLQIAGLMVWSPDSKSASDVTVLRQAAKNVLYTVANSNAMRGEFIRITPAWQIVMFVVDGVLAVGLAAWGFFAIRKALKKEN